MSNQFKKNNFKREENKIGPNAGNTLDLDQYKVHLIEDDTRHGNFKKIFKIWQNKEALENSKKITIWRRIRLT